MEDLLKTLTKYGLIAPNRNTSLMLGVVFIILSIGLAPHKNDIFGSLHISEYEVTKYLNATLFALGLLFILIYIVLLGWYYVSYWRKKSNYQKKYPISKLNISFSLLNVNGVGYLIDHTAKTIHWIENWTTAADLAFIGYWKIIKQKRIYNIYLNEVQSSLIVNNQPLTTKLIHSYRFAEGIRTREVPGSGPIF